MVLKPKDLPDAMRGVGRMINKARRMAGEFQGQFNQALREANLEDVKKEFDSIRQATSAVTGGLSPANLVGNQIKNAMTGPTATQSAPMIDTALTSSSPTAIPAERGAAATMIEEDAEVDIPSAFAMSPAFRRK